MRNLRSSGFPTVATGNDISYQNDLFDLDPKNCSVNPAIGKTLVVSVLPPGHTATVTTIRAFVLQGANPIPDGSVYSCRFSIKPSTLPGSYHLTNSSTIAFGSDGTPHAFVTGADGAITVSLVGP
jgi:hypothetical protein